MQDSAGIKSRKSTDFQPKPALSYLKHRINYDCLRQNALNDILFQKQLCIFTKQFPTL